MMIDECFTFMSGASLSIASSIFTFLYQISTNQEVKQKVLAEIK
jgi:cytochrome P450